MSNKPKGAMGSPYVSSDENGPSMAKLMGDAFERLHENSWDGGKEVQQKRIEKANKEIEQKIEKNKQCKVQQEIEVVSNDIVNFDDLSGVKINNEYDNTSSPAKFTPQIKKEMMQVAIDSDLEIDQVTDEKIIVTDKDGNKFAILPI